MYTDLDHYLLAVASVLPLTLLCYWLTYLVLRTASDFSLTWPLQFGGMALAALIGPFVVPFFYSSLAEFTEENTFVIFPIGFIASVIAQIAVWLVANKLMKNNSEVASIHAAGPMLSGVTKIILPDGGNSRTHVSSQQDESSGGIEPSRPSTDASNIRGFESNATKGVSATLEQLEKVSQLRQAGALSESEYVELKARIIAQK